jgi:hypothetical protein
VKNAASSAHSPICDIMKLSGAQPVKEIGNQADSVIHRSRAAPVAPYLPRIDLPAHIGTIFRIAYRFKTLVNFFYFLEYCTDLQWRHQAKSSICANEGEPNSEKPVEPYQPALFVPAGGN